MCLLFNVFDCLVRDVLYDVVWFVCLCVLSVFVRLCFLCALIVMCDVMLYGVCWCFCGCACGVRVV